MIPGDSPPFTESTTDMSVVLRLRDYSSRSALIGDELFAACFKG